MKALFYTTQTSDCANHVRAWEGAYGKAELLTYDHRGLCNDWQLIEAIERHRPSVVFYIGAHEARGNPKPETLKLARKHAPVVNLCSDAADKPWHKVLEIYKRRECFDLQVSIDGARGAPVDFVTLTPVDPRPFDNLKPERDIRCGFSGTVGRWNARSEIVNALEWFGGLTVRPRSPKDGYFDHVRFMKRCRMLLNISRTGTGLANHIKGRVLEAGWAGCALLESAGSPIEEWFPNDCFFLYRHPKEAAAMISELSDDVIAHRAARLSEEVRERFSPKLIYGEILEELGRVGPAVSQPAA